MRVGVVGAGQVGSSAAYAVALISAASKIVIVIVDVDEKLARAQAEGIRHAGPFLSTSRLRAERYEDLRDAGVVPLRCGVAQKPGETGLQLLAGEVRVEEVIRHEPDGAYADAAWARP